MSALAKLRAFTGTGAAGRVTKFESALTASDARLEQRTDALAEVAAAFVENADTAALQAAEAAVADEQKTRAALVRGLETARKALADEQAAEAARVEVERQAGFLKQAEALDGEMRDAFRRFIEYAEKSVEVCAQITGNKAARFDIAFIMGEVAQEAAAGSARVLFVQPQGFALRMPALSPKLAAVIAEQGEIAASQRKAVAGWFAADSARAKEATRPGFGHPSAAEIAARSRP